MKKYWKSLDEQRRQEAGIPPPAKEEQDDSIMGLMEKGMDEDKGSRRDFLKFWGFSLGAAALAASCKRPVHKAIPYLIQPEEVAPGKATYYASSFYDGHEYASILVKNRDGRPIKIEPNDLSPFGAKGTTARVQASLLNLYDDSRLKGPEVDGQPVSWDEVDAKMSGIFEKVSGEGKKIAFLTGGIISPSMQKIITGLKEKYPGFNVVTYNPVSVYGMLEANQLCFGQAVIPSCHFDRARIIAGFGADFLGTWGMPNEYIRQYASTRSVSKEQTEMSRHYQFESGMSVTGSNADYRIRIKPSDEKLILAHLYNEIAGLLGAGTRELQSIPYDIATLAAELVENKGAGLVVTGSNDVHVQIIVNGINSLLDNYGTTIDLNRVNHVRQGTDREFEELLAGIEAGKVGACIVHNVNPAYDYRDPDRIQKAFEKIESTISFATSPDETSILCQYVCPDHHYLESWGDAEPVTGFVSLAQPLIANLFDTRQAQESLLKWSGVEISYHQLIKDTWEQEIFPTQSGISDFNTFWNGCLRKGFFEYTKLPFRSFALDATAVEAVLNDTAGSGNSGKLELQLYESFAMGTGSYANNPWLQELPDPITKVSWDNFAAVSLRLAEENELVNGDVIRINDLVELPVLVQPGQAYETVSIALGYGRTVCGKAGRGVGANAFPLVGMVEGERIFQGQEITFAKTGSHIELALTQEHHTMEGRPIVREATLNEFKEDPYAGNHHHLHAEEHHTSLYEHPEFDGYHWGLAIDLNKCTGCSSCAIACQAENNIAVVGKDEVRKRRILHWIRLDRYYSDDPENPEVFHQPVMCQHCDHAPCENVCPVSATNHSNEGLNQMSYNRCIGTKYCINNCPYRVRRFNWYAYVNNDEYDYHMNSKLGKMVLNPDVVIRERGVVEKCSFCVQRIQEKKLQAKLEGRPLEDGEIQPACVQTCPAGALVFGDLNDKESKVSKMYDGERNYHLLEELHTLPTVGYLTKIRNRSVIGDQRE